MINSKLPVISSLAFYKKRCGDKSNKEQGLAILVLEQFLKLVN